MSAPRIGVVTVFRVAAAVAAVAALLVGDTALLGGRRLRIVAIDVSASMTSARGSAAISPQMRAQITHLVADLSRGDRAAVLVFGDDARVAGAVSAPDELVSALVPQTCGQDATSYAAAISMAAAIRASARDCDRAEIVFVSDGRATDSETALLDAARALRVAGGATIRRVAPEPSGSNDARPLFAVRDLRGPGRVHPGEPFALEARGVAPGGATLSVLRGTSVVATRTVSGEFRAVFARIEDAVGAATYRAVISQGVAGASSDVLVAGEGSVLVVSRDGDRSRDGDPLRAVFALALAPTPVFTSIREQTLPAFDAFDLIVLADASASDIGDGDLLPSLERVVAAGGSLLLLGGEHAFAAGGWSGRRIDELSPLRARPPQDEGIAVMLAIDASGSMGETWDGAALRRDAAVARAAATFSSRAGRDVRLSVRRFRNRLLSESPAAFYGSAVDDRLLLKSELANVPLAGGSTSIGPVLDDALTAFAARSERTRHLIVFSDGRTAERVDDLRAGLKRLRAAGVDVTLVVPGPLGEESGADWSFLAAARAESVAVLSADRPERLEPLLEDVGAAMALAEPFAGTTTLRLSDAARDVLPSGASYAVSRRNRAWLSENATAVLLADGGDGVDGGREVVLAERTLGAGRVIALACDPSWATSPELLRDVVRLAARRASAAARVERGSENGVSVLRVRIAAGTRRAAVAVFEDGGGELGRAPLVTAEGGLAVVAFPTPASGGREPTLVRFLDEAGAQVTACGLDRPAPPEYQDPAVLDLDALTASASVPPANSGTPLRPYLALGALLLLLAAQIALRRDGVKSPGPVGR